MRTRKYSNEIANEISNFLKKDEWHFSFDEQKGVFDFGLRIKSKIRKVSYLVKVNESDFSVFAIAPVNADSDDKEMMANMAEFICRANYGLKRGCFEFDFRDGEIRYKVHVPCDGIIPTSEMIKDSIYCHAHMFDRYGDGILRIIFNNASAGEAIELCEGSEESEIGRLIAQMMEEYPDADVETLTAHIAERLGIKSSDDESEDEDETDTDTMLSRLSETLGIDCSNETDEDAAKTDVSASLESKHIIDSEVIKAAEIVVTTGVVLVTYLQRMMHIGYAKAASLIDFLKEYGIINENSEVTMTKSQFEKWKENFVDGQYGGNE